MSRVLIVTHVPFWRQRNGATARISSLVSVLGKAGHEVGLFYVGSLNPEDIACLENVGIEIFSNALDGLSLIYRSFLSASFAVWRCLPRYLLKLWWRFNKKSIPYRSFTNNSLRLSFGRFLKEFDPSVVIVEYIRFAFLVPSERSQCLWLIDTHDVMCRRNARFCEQGLVHWVDISEQEEADVLGRFDAVLAIQQGEAEILRNMIGADKVFLVSHSPTIDPVPKRFSGPLRFGYLGADNEVNEDAVVWFLKYVWPELSEKLPGVEFCIAGHVCRRLLDHNVPGIKFLGRVDSLKEFYGDVDFVINPVRSGGGLKIKNVEALSHGIPLITTTIGAEGFPACENQPFLVADTAEQFLEKILTFEDKACRDQLRGNCFEYLQQYFSMDASYRPLLKLIASRE